MVRANIEIKVKNGKGVTNKLKKVVNGFLSDKRSMTKVNKIIESELKVELETEKPQSKSLSDKSIKARRNLALYNKTSNFFAPNRSNLHFSGQLVASIFSKFKGAGQFVLDFNNKKRKPYKKKNGKNAKSNYGNKQIASELRDNGWKLLFFPRERAPREIANKFREYIRRNNKL